MNGFPQNLALICCEKSRAPRMLALARALGDCEDIAVRIALKGADSPLIRHFAHETFSTPAELMALARAHKPELLILDKGSGLARGALEELRRDCLLTAVLEENSDLRLACDFAYYPQVPPAMALDWTGARTVPRIGWEWILPGPNPRLAPVRGFSPRPILLVAMGENGGLAERMAHALSALDSSFRIRFAIPAGMPNPGKLAAAIVAIRENYETVEGADDFSTEYASADLALCAFGDTAYELAAFGVPALWLAENGDDAGRANAMAQTGMGLSLGTANSLDDASLLAAVKSLIQDAVRRREMRETCLGLVDGLGAWRIAGDLAAALRQERAPLRAAR